MNGERGSRETPSLFYFLRIFTLKYENDRTIIKQQDKILSRGIIIPHWSYYPYSLPVKLYYLFCPDVVSAVCHDKRNTLDYIFRSCESIAIQRIADFRESRGRSA